MPGFNYVGNDRKGEPVAGTAEADSGWALIQALRAEGIFVHAVQALDGPRGLARRERPLRLEELNQFTEQLASLTRSGMPLAPALDTLSREVQGRRLRRLLETARYEVEGGNTLEEVFARHGESFPPLYISLIRVGERTGNLPGVLQQLSAHGQRHRWLRQRLLVAVAYPIFLLVALLLFMGVFVPEVIGQFQVMYGQMGAELPPITAAALAAGHFVRGIGFPVLALLAAIGLAGHVLLWRAPRGGVTRNAWERILWQSPGVGPAYRAILSARFFRALGMLLENGAPIVESLHLAGIATASARFASASQRAAARVAQGETVAGALQDTGIFRAMHAWMLKQGEAAGDFPRALGRLADACDREAEQRQRASLATFGPGLVALCGILVGLAVVACFVPIFQFSSLIHG